MPTVLEVGVFRLRRCERACKREFAWPSSVPTPRHRVKYLHSTRIYLQGDFGAAHKLRKLMFYGSDRLHGRTVRLVLLIEPPKKLTVQCGQLLHRVLGTFCGTLLISMIDCTSLHSVETLLSVGGKGLQRASQIVLCVSVIK
jgi:hypothetical protein